jgi:hypothetical protein
LNFASFYCPIFQIVELRTISTKNINIVQSQGRIFIIIRYRNNFFLIKVIIAVYFLVLKLSIVLNVAYEI